MMIWVLRDPRTTPEALGLIPSFLSADDPRPAREQFHERYVFGGWQPIAALTLIAGECLKYPGDPPLWPIAETQLGDERIILYPASIVAIVQPDGSFEAARMD